MKPKPCPPHEWDEIEPGPGGDREQGVWICLNCDAVKMGEHIEDATLNLTLSRNRQIRRQKREAKPE